MFIFVNCQRWEHLRSMVDDEKVRDHRHCGRAGARCMNQVEFLA